MRGEDWIGVVEAAYDVDAPDDAWLSRLVESGARVFDHGLGACGYAYDASDPARMTILGFASAAGQRCLERSWLQAGLSAAGAEYVRANHHRRTFALATETAGFRETGGDVLFRAHGFRDAIGANGIDPEGFGVWLGAPLASTPRVARSTRLCGERIGAHLAAGLRLRRRLASARPPAEAPWGADAILSPRGALEHATGEEERTAVARRLLRDAAVAIDRARGKLRRADQDEALEGWTALVDARWTLVDKFDHGGKRYLLARRNEPHVPGLAALSERERQVVAHAVLGHSNKHIAYTLGIAHSTVRVLLQRAARKLGARTRAELVAVAMQASDATSGGAASGGAASGGAASGGAG